MRTEAMATLQLGSRHAAAAAIPGQPARSSRQAGRQSPCRAAGTQQQAGRHSPPQHPPVAPSSSPAPAARTRTALAAAGSPPRRWGPAAPAAGHSVTWGRGEGSKGVAAWAGWQERTRHWGAAGVRWGHAPAGVRGGAGLASAATAAQQARKAGQPTLEAKYWKPGTRPLST